MHSGRASAKSCPDGKFRIDINIGIQTLPEEVFMRRFWSCVLVMGLFLWAGICTAQDAGREKAAVAAAEEWLSLVDAGDYGQSWQESSEYFRNAVAEDRWEQSLKAVRYPLGRLISREVKSAIYQTALPGAPDGQYVVIQFKTSFENKQSAVETVTPMLGKDGIWRVSGYFIR